MRPIRTALSKIRLRLGDDPDKPTYICTEPRVGYRMVEGVWRRKNSHEELHKLNDLDHSKHLIPYCQPPQPYSSSIGNGSLSLTRACDSRMDSPRLVLSPQRLLI